MYNRIIIVGRLGRDPEMRYTPSGRAVTNFSVATNRKYKSGEETVEETEWHNVVAWARLGEIVNQYAKSGQLVLVEGRVHTEKYTDKAGVERYSTKIIADAVQFLSRGGERVEADEAEAESEPAAAGEVVNFG